MANTTNLPTREDVPEHILDSMARGVVIAMEAFYADPENVRKFEEWKAKRDAARAAMA